MRIVIDGQEAKIRPACNIERVLAALSELPPPKGGSVEFITNARLAETLGVTLNTLSKYSNRREVQEYKLSNGAEVYWGHPKAVEIGREKLEGRK